MSLQNIQYDKIMREYDAKRMQAAYELSLRTEEVYTKSPKVKEIDDAIAEESVRSGKLAIMGDYSALDTLKQRLETMAAERKTALTEGGFPADYLELKYTCNKCKDTGLIGKEYCSCFKTAVSSLIYDESNIKEIIEYENFSTFNYGCYSDAPEDYDAALEATPRQHMMQVVSNLKRFIENFDTEYTNLLIYGETGLGKTFLTNCVAKELLDSAHTVRYFTSYSLFSMLEDYRFRYNEYERNNSGQYESVFDCDLLIIDDLGSELANSFTASNLFSIINERNLRRKSTVITTNLNPSLFGQLFGERIFSRINQNYVFIKLIGQDIRNLV